MSGLYEQPLPALDVDTETIVIETKDNTTGQFKLKNTGGGLLAGRVISRCPGLSFTPDIFEGNKQVIAYSFNPSEAGLGIGKTLNSTVYVSTNGGEKKIDVTIKITKMSIETKDGYTIANLLDFYEYALRNPTGARRIFTDSEFYMLLLAVGYEYMEVYESLHKDANRERAMDNFFILSGLKGKTTISITDKSLEFIQKPDEKEIIKGLLTITRSDEGYVDMPINIINDSNWLSTPSSKLSTSDFSDINDMITTTIEFNINPRNIQGPYARAQIAIGTETCEIIYRRTAPLALRLNRGSYRYEDKGLIEVTNNTKTTMQIEVFCPEKYIHFSARAYPVENYGEIPFEVKLSTFMSAQLFFRKLPYMETEIEIKATVPGAAYKKRLPIIVGEW